jgi:hypothetical protein
MKHAHLGQVLTTWTLAGAIACSASPTAPRQPEAAETAPPPSAQAREPETPEPTSAEAKVPTASEPKAGDSLSPATSTSSAVPFPPAALSPLEAKTAQPGDGQWQQVPEAGTVRGQPIFYRTTLHPNPLQKWVYVVLVAIDLRRAELHLVAGTEEPANDTISKEERGGRVPVAHQSRLAAVFNGGFKASHGRYGMRLGSKLFVKPRPDACTIVLRSPSEVDIGTFGRLTLAGDETFRQTPPCLVEDGKLNPLLANERSTKKWGGAEDGRKDIRRTALAVDDTGSTLYFAFADWITAKELGVALEKAGVRAAAELDINWSFTRFLFFAPAEDGSGLEVSATLVDQIEHRKKGYVQKSEPRDFFYVTRAPDP